MPTQIDYSPAPCFVGIPTFEAGPNMGISTRNGNSWVIMGRLSVVYPGYIDVLLCRLVFEYL